MKKSILSIGKTLNRTEQREINGGLGGVCACTSNYTQTSQNECEFTPRGGFPGAICSGVIVNGLCCISSL
jgi:hypothetical protein